MCDAQEEVRHFERGERESVPLEGEFAGFAGYEFLCV